MLTISAVVLLHLGVIAVLVGVNGCRTTTGFERDGDRAAYTGAAGVPAASPAYTPGVPLAGLNEAPRPVGAASETKPARPAVTAVGKGNAHTVVAGESLWVIARREGVSLDALCGANGLERNAVLRVGQKIVIPDGSTPVAAPKAPTGAAPAAPAGPSPLAAPAGGFGGFGGVTAAAPTTPAAPAAEAPKPVEPSKPASSLAAPAGGFGGFGGGSSAPAAPAAPATR